MKWCQNQKALKIYLLKLIPVNIDNIEFFARARWNRNENCRIIWESFYFIIAILFYKNTLSLTEEIKKPEPCRQHSTMSFKIKYQNQCPKIWIIPKEIKLYQTIDTQKFGNSWKWCPKIWSTPEKVPKIIAYLHTSRCMYVTFSDFLALLGRPLIAAVCIYAQWLFRDRHKILPTGIRYNNWSWCSSMIQWLK